MVPRRRAASAVAVRVAVCAVCVAVMTVIAAGGTVVDLDDVLVVRTIHNGVPNDEAVVDLYNQRNLGINATDCPSCFAWPVAYLRGRSGSKVDQRAIVNGLLITDGLCDVLLSWSGWVSPDMLEPSRMVNVSDLWSGMGLMDTFAASFAPAVTGQDGAKYMVPYSASFFAFYRHANYTSQAPTTWQDLIAQCDVHMATNPGHGCILVWTTTLSSPETRIAVILDMVILAMHGAEFLDEIQSGAVSLRDQRFVDSLAFVAFLVDGGYFEVTSSLDNLAHGKNLFFVSLLGVTHYLGRFLDAAAIAAMVPFRPPSFDGRVHPSFTLGIAHMYSIPALTPKRSEAADYIQFMLASDNVASILQASTMEWPVFVEPSTVALLNVSNPLLDSVVEIAYMSDVVISDSSVGFTSLTMRAAWTGAVGLLRSGESVEQTVRVTEAVRVAEYLGTVLPPEPSVPAGIYEESLVLVLTTPTPDTVVHVTRDGSPPYSASPIHSADDPILITQADGAVVIRAVARHPLLGESEFFEGHYIVEPALPRIAVVEKTEASSRATTVALAVIFPMLLLLIALLLVVLWRKSRSRDTVVTLAVETNAVIPLSDLELTSRIGSGVHGQVYAASWGATKVAVKLLARAGAGCGEQSTSQSTLLLQSRSSLRVLEEGQPESSMLSTKQMASFVSLLERVMSLRHPHVITPMGVTLSPPAIVSEFVERGTLFNCLHNPLMTLDVSVRLRWAHQISMGLAFLHDAGILALSLRSSNVLLTSSWSAKISDFADLGLMKSVSVTGCSGPVRRVSGEVDSIASSTCSDESASEMEMQRVGSGRADADMGVGLPPYECLPNYLYWAAPEVLTMHKPPSTAADIYSFGIVLYELFARALPYADAVGPFRVALGVVNGTMRPNVAYVQRTPVALDMVELMETTWDSNASNRPTAGFVAARLSELYEPYASSVVFPSSMGDEPTGVGFVVSVCVGSFASLFLASPWLARATMSAVHRALQFAVDATRGYAFETGPHKMDVAFSSARRAVAFLVIVRKRLAGLVPDDTLVAMMPSPLAGLHEVYGFVRLSFGVASGPLSTVRDASTFKLAYTGNTVDRARLMVGMGPPGHIVIHADDAVIVGSAAALMDVPVVHSLALDGEAVSVFLSEAEAEVSWIKLHGVSETFLEWVARGRHPSADFLGSLEAELLSSGRDTEAAVREWRARQTDGTTWIVEPGDVTQFMDSISTQWLGTGSSTEALYGTLEHPHLPPRVVFKRLLVQQESDIEYALEFAAEFATVFRVASGADQCPHLVPVFAASLHQGMLGYFVPYMEAGTLRSDIQSADPLVVTWPMVVSAGLGIARAVHAVLGLGISLWVSPVRLCNAFLSSRGTAVTPRVMISDYGFPTSVRAAAGTSLAQSPVGEAPELLRGELEYADEAAIVFALAMSLFELVTGAPAFAGTGLAPVMVADAILNGERPVIVPRQSLRHHAFVQPVSDLITMSWADLPASRPTLSTLIGILEALR